MGRGQKVSTLTGVWRKLIPTLMDDLKGSRFQEEVTADGVEITRELELNVVPEDVTELVYLMIKLEQMKSCLMDEQ